MYNQLTQVRNLRKYFNLICNTSNRDIIGPNDLYEATTGGKKILIKLQKLSS